MSLTLVFGLRCFNLRDRLHSLNALTSFSEHPFSALTPLPPSRLHAFPTLVAHDCGYPLSRYTCRATRVAADFLDFIAFCRCSSGVAPHPLKILVSHLPPPPPMCREVSHRNLVVWKGVALHGGVAATVAGVALHCATKFPTCWQWVSQTYAWTLKLRCTPDPETFFSNMWLWEVVAIKPILKRKCRAWYDFVEWAASIRHLMWKKKLWNFETQIWLEIITSRDAKSACFKLEEDKRATTNVQNGLVSFFLLSFILFSYFWTKTAVKPLNSKKKSWRKNSEKLWKSVKMCGKLPKSVKKCRDDLPFSCCPLVFLWFNKGSQTSCTELISCFFWPKFGRKRSHHVMDARCWLKPWAKQGKITLRIALGRNVRTIAGHHVFLNRVQQTVSGNKPSQYPPDAIRCTPFRCSLRGKPCPAG